MRFSVITPSFRQLEWLDLCAASIADQGVELEHIIQDAGTPGIEAWTATHSGVRVFVEKDAGMYDAINRGLRRATGDLCAYLNCDEQYLPGTLRRVSEFFGRNPNVDVVFGDAILADAALEPLAYRRAILPRRRHTILRPLGILTCSTFFRRKIIDDGAIFDPAWKIIGDKIWILSLLARGYRMAVIPQPLAIFALTGDNLSQHADFRAERIRWRNGVPPLLRLAQPLVALEHWLRKWRAGAYCQFNGDLHYYRKNNFMSRTAFTDLALGPGWPRQASREAKIPLE